MEIKKFTRGGNPIWLFYAQKNKAPLLGVLSRYNRDIKVRSKISKFIERVQLLQQALYYLTHPIHFLVLLIQVVRVVVIVWFAPQ